MQTYWLTDRKTDEVLLVDADTIEQLLGIELGYVEWCIRVDEMFENAEWRVWGHISALNLVDAAA